jgi:CubicO group peptidase (beta-lactamase class C family)
MLDWDLEPALEVATRAVGEGALPGLVFGVIDAEGRQEIIAVSGSTTEVHDDSVFFIASVTKAVVATALMLYVDEGRLDLRAPLARYVPAFAGQGREAVTAWHLLTHTSGLPDIPTERLRSERPTYARVLAETLTSVPRWEPGTRYEYNSSAWSLLAETMARLSSSTWPQVLHQRLLRPLGMTDTTFDGRPLRDRIVPVDGVGAGNRLVAEVLLWFLARVRLPGGGLFGTAPDLLRLGQALLGPGLLSREAVEAMARQQIEGVPHIAEDGRVSYIEHGLGWRRAGGDWPSGQRVLTHGGHSGSRLWIDLERGFAFSFITNVWGVSSDVARAVLERVYDACP